MIVCICCWNFEQVRLEASGVWAQCIHCRYGGESYQKVSEFQMSGMIIFVNFPERYDKMCDMCICVFFVEH